MKNILVTGGAGFIGSHTCTELLQAGYGVVVVDNLSNSKVETLDNIRKIAGKSITFYQTDIRDEQRLTKIFEENKIDAVIHFAALKAVGESVYKPLEYYANNLTGTLTLCEVMRKFGCKTIVFSSSATVYGMNNTVPFKEDSPLSATNPYGHTKVMIEQMLGDIATADPQWSVMLLRYFNPIGAHASGLIGENPNGIPNNLLPYIAQVAVGKLPELSIYGNDYPTPDGTGVRDYIHVVDLAQGHIAALSYALEHHGVQAVNLGTGTGSSVVDVVNSFEKASGKTIAQKFVPRRAGDIATCYADTTKAKELLNWTAQKTLDDMCADSWNFTQKNQ